MRRLFGNPAEIELWRCGYSAHCTVTGCERTATTLARYFGGRRRLLRQRELCDRHVETLRATSELEIQDRRSEEPAR
jgi:hypothetical protein